MAMWNQVLRRIVEAEEQQQAARRRLQLAQAAALSSSAANPSAKVPLAPAPVDKRDDQRVDACAPPCARRERPLDAACHDDRGLAPPADDYLQKHLLSRPAARWTCLEDTSQATCLALNASQTLLAVGERDGRVTIWDNTTIRVVTRELDPTLVAPAEASVALARADSMPSGSNRVHDDAPTRADRDVVPTAFKVVSQCAWSCDSRYLFAGCEEKATRRARLCVWHVTAAALVAVYPFEGTITALSAHPHDPQQLLVSCWNARPVLLNLGTGQTTGLTAVPLEVDHPLAPAPARHPVLATCARYGPSGTRIYCATSRSTLVVLQSRTLQCLDTLHLNVVVQHVDLCVNWHESAMLVTSAKGIHELAMEPTTRTDKSGTAYPKVGLREVALHSTGAVRAPWALCCFSGDDEFVVGTPVVRHRHVGENGLFTWHRASKQTKTTAQHNVGVPSGVLALEWDRWRQSVLAVSTTGALYVLEEHGTTTWPGAMYPAGFRLITDNEVHLAVFEGDAAARKRDKAKLTEVATMAHVDVFRVESLDEHIGHTVDGEVAHGVAHGVAHRRPFCCIPAVPMAHDMHRRQGQSVDGVPVNEDKLVGLGYSVFEPLSGTVGNVSKRTVRRYKTSTKKRRRR